jgi:hypothetical protein
MIASNILSTVYIYIIVVREEDHSACTDAGRSSSGIVSTCSVYDIKTGNCPCWMELPTILMCPG